MENQDQDFPLTDKEYQAICKFFDLLQDESGITLRQIMQFILIHHSWDCITSGFGEISLRQNVRHKGRRYFTRMVILCEKEGDETLKERAYRIADILLSSGSGRLLDLREELKRAVMAGYDLHVEDF